MEVLPDSCRRVFPETVLWGRVAGWGQALKELMHGLIGCHAGAITSSGVLYDIAQVRPAAAEPIGSSGDPYLADYMHRYGDVAVAIMDVISDVNTRYRLTLQGLQYQDSL